MLPTPQPDRRPALTEQNYTHDQILVTLIKRLEDEYEQEDWLDAWADIRDLPEYHRPRKLDRRVRCTRMYRIRRRINRIYRKTIGRFIRKV